MLWGCRRIRSYRRNEAGAPVSAITAFGSRLPELVTSPPGPASQAFTDRLRGVEARNVTFGGDTSIQDLAKLGCPGALLSVVEMQVKKASKRSQEESGETPAVRLGRRPNPVAGLLVRQPHAPAMEELGQPREARGMNIRQLERRRREAPPRDLRAVRAEGRWEEARRRRRR